MIVPSSSFSATLPVKPSVTTTSAAPASRSRPSVLPAKLSSLAASSSCASSVELVALLRLLADREQADLAGCATPRISSAKIAPMCANWSRCSGRASAFAPQSSSTEGRRGPGSARRSPGAGHPGAGGSRAGTAASIAPVLPAETTASALPSPTARHAATSELSGFARTASAGFSSIAITVGRLDELEPVRVEAGRAVEDRDDPVRGGLERAGDDLLRAAVAAHGVDGDADHRAYGTRGAERLDLAALVRLAGRADAVRPLRLAARRADVHARRLDPVLRAALVAAGLRGFLLGDGHGSARQCS